MENEKFITLLTVTFPHEMAVIRGRLEAEGITCFAKDELTVQVHPFYSNAIGGVKLQVLERDLHQAVEILKYAGHYIEENLQSSDESPHINKYSNNQQAAEEGAGIICSICGSEEVVKTRKTGWLFLLTSLMLAFPTPFLRRKYYCFNCRQEFKLKR
jgi:DNA-directed RNA polymerase subunit RPC12/RpoP